VAITQLVKTGIVKHISADNIIVGNAKIKRDVCFTIHILLSAPDAVKKHSGECVTKFGGYSLRETVNLLP
jgi:hypothetical protein